MTSCGFYDPPWLVAARRDVGVKENLGPNDATWIRRMWADLSGSWLRGQPWCGGALAYWMNAAAVPYPKAYYRALAWLDWGYTIYGPAVGAVAVFERHGGGHVALVEGVNADGDLMCLGGNQKDSVRVSAFRRERVLGYRWPVEHLYLLRNGNLPVLANNGGVSRNEV